MFWDFTVFFVPVGEKEGIWAYHNGGVYYPSQLHVCTHTHILLTWTLDLVGLHTRVQLMVEASVVNHHCTVPKPHQWRAEREKALDNNHSKMHVSALVNW